VTPPEPVNGVEDPSQIVAVPLATAVGGEQAWVSLDGDPTGAIGSIGSSAPAAEKVASYERVRQFLLGLSEPSMTSPRNRASDTNVRVLLATLKMLEARPDMKLTVPPRSNARYPVVQGRVMWMWKRM
jgi:hypothetical protein